MVCESALFLCYGLLVSLLSVLWFMSQPSFCPMVYESSLFPSPHRSILRVDVTAVCCARPDTNVMVDRALETNSIASFLLCVDMSDVC